MADRLDLQLLALGLRRTAWIRFWTQTGLGIVILGVLMFNNIGGSLSRNADKALGLGPGLSLTTLAFLVLLFSLWQSWLVVRLGRALASGVRPSRGEASRTIKRSLFADCWAWCLPLLAINPWLVPCLCRPRCRRQALPLEQGEREKIWRSPPWRCFRC